MMLEFVVGSNQHIRPDDRHAQPHTSPLYLPPIASNQQRFLNLSFSAASNGVDIEVDINCDSDNA